MSVNPDTKSIFDKYSIPTVPILYQTDAFCLEDWKIILDIIVSTLNIEGGVFCQEDCYQKLVINYSTEKFIIYAIQERFPEYAKLQLALCNAISHKHISEKNNRKTKKVKLNTELIEEEYSKELSHRDWKDELTEFYSISSDDMAEIHKFIFNSELVNKIVTSLNEVDDFKDLSKRMWSDVRNYIKKLFIDDKNSNKNTFDIST
jgi:hypothetical protein